MNRMRNIWSAALVVAASVLTASAEEVKGIRALQLDLARQKESVSFVKAYAKRAANVGYNTLVLYLEDRVKTPSYPYCSDTESYSLAEMADLVTFCTGLGLDVVPVISPLGHTERFLSHPELQKFAEVPDGGVGRFGKVKNCTVFCLTNPEARAWMENYIREVVSVFPGRNLHLGFDETWDLGYCPRCRPILEKEGLAKLYLRSVKWADEVAKRLGKRMWMWDDYFDFFPEAIEEVPRDILMCCWNYDRNIEKAGPRGHFGGRLRRDNLKIYEQLGFECVFCPWFEYQNVRTFTEYAASRKTSGAFFTQWEMETDFHGTFLPRMLGAGLLWSGKASLAGGDWLDAGIAAAYPLSDVRLRRTIRGLVLDQLKLKFDMPSVAAALNGPSHASNLPYWRNAVEELRASPTRPGVGDVPADPLSEAALLDDLAVRSEMTLLCFDAMESVRYLVDPARVASVAREEKARLVRMRTRWNELVARREQQWKTWRGDIGSELKERLNASLPKLADEMLKRPDAAADDEWIFEADVAMVDTHGAPNYVVEGRFGTTWRQIAAGNWKPGSKGAGYSPKLVPVTFAGRPDALRVTQKGYGAGALCHVSLRNRSERLVPTAVLAASGRVRDPENLLTDDFRETRFGDPDCTAAVLDPRLADNPSSVTLSIR